MTTNFKLLTTSKKMKSSLVKEILAFVVVGLNILMRGKSGLNHLFLFFLPKYKLKVHTDASVFF